MLLVEDSPGDVRLTQEAFREANAADIDLHVAVDGVEAMAFLKQEDPHADAPRPDLILLDLNLPRMDGREVLAQIKGDASLKTIPTVILTTSRGRGGHPQELRAPGQRYLNKPVQLDDFESLVQSIHDFWLTGSSCRSRRHADEREPHHAILLLIEDNPGDARLLREMFNEHGLARDRADARGEHARRPRSISRSHAVDVILLDLGLPDAQGLEAVRRAHAAAPRVPLVVLTGLDDEALASQALQEGAEDYLIKGQIEPRGLLRALRYAIERKTMEEALFVEKERAQVTLNCIGDAVDQHRHRRQHHVPQRLAAEHDGLVV